VSAVDPNVLVKSRASPPGWTGGTPVPLLTMFRGFQTAALFDFPQASIAFFIIEKNILLEA